MVSKRNKKNYNQILSFIESSVRKKKKTILNDLRIIIYKRIHEFFVERISVCNVIENINGAWQNTVYHAHTHK